MTLEDILKITENKLQTLRMQESSATQAGDLAAVVEIQRQIVETEITIAQLKKTVEG